MKRLIKVGFAIVTLALFGCHSQDSALFEATKQRADADQIRKAVMPLFTEYHYAPDTIGTVIPLDRIPESIKALPIFALSPTAKFEEVQILTMFTGKTNREDALMFIVGSGFGSRGIIVCKNENDRQFDKWRGVKYWKKGIYFYDDL